MQHKVVMQVQQEHFLDGDVTDRPEFFIEPPKKYTSWALNLQRIREQPYKLLADFLGDCEFTQAFNEDNREVEGSQWRNCSFTDNHYLQWMPLYYEATKDQCEALLRENNKKWLLPWMQHSDHFDYVLYRCVSKFELAGKDTATKEHLSMVSEALLGHPYVDGFHPDDGDGYLHTYGVKLDNGASLWGIGWVWYNK
jgi:hypothetical protein